MSKSIFKLPNIPPGFFQALEHAKQQQPHSKEQRLAWLYERKNELIKRIEESPTVPPDDLFESVKKFEEMIYQLKNPHLQPNTNINKV